jgi:hypothetical protein
MFVARRDNWAGEGGGIFIYSSSHTVKTIAFKINPSGRTRICEYATWHQLTVQLRPWILIYFTQSQIVCRPISYNMYIESPQS